MKKKLKLLLFTALAACLAASVEASSTFGVGGNVTYVTADDSETIPTVGGKVETDSAIGGSLVGHLNLGDEGFLRYFATELAVDFSRHKVKAKTTTLGNLDAGKVSLLLASWSLLWMIAPDWNFCPYIGAGVSYVNLRKAGSGVIDRLKYKSKAGGLVQAGLKYYPSDAWSVDLDIKKIGFRSGSEPKIQFTEAGVTGEVNHPVNPLIVGLGATVYFN